jgi:bacterioferritin (cytochrome b1)
VKADPAVIDALNECLKWERTLIGCFDGYYHYFRRWRIHRIADWMKAKRKHAFKRACKLETRINDLDAIPSGDGYGFDLEPVTAAGDLVGVFEYFAGGEGQPGTLPEARDAYEAVKAASKPSGDSVSRHLATRLKARVEADLAHVEAKLNKIKLIGPEAYLAHHMH